MKTIFKIIFILFTLLPFMSKAQLSGKGQIVLVQGDTIEGFIQIEKKQFYDIVKYKKEKDGRFEKMPLSNLYRIIIKDKVYENLFFVKGDVQGGNVYTCRLCLCVVDGFMKLYKESIDMFYHGADGIVNNNEKKSTDETYYVVKGNGQAEEINSKFFVKQSQKTFIDYKAIVQSIKEKKYAYDDIVKIVENCNESYYSDILDEY
jgi:hypothetical protein